MFNGGVARKKTGRKLEVGNWQKTRAPLQRKLVENGRAASEKTGGVAGGRTGRKLEVKNLYKTGNVLLK